MSTVTNYSAYFPTGAPVTINVPLPGNKLTQSAGIISEIDEDFVSVKPSGEESPAHLQLHVGQILELNHLKGSKSYSCRAIIVYESSTHEVLMRFIGEIVSDELREYYRIDAFLPVRYYIPRSHDLEELKEQWIERRRKRMEENVDSMRRRWDSSIMSDTADEPHEPAHEPDTDEIAPLAANISGGGIRFVTHQMFTAGEHLLLEILIPAPHRILDVVAKVAISARNEDDGGHESFTTGMQFTLIDERDRDAIVNYIADVQLKRIRQLHETDIYHFETSPQPPIIKRAGFRRVLMLGIVLALLLLALAAYFHSYSQSHPKNEIEEIFEGGLRRYLEKLK